VILLLEAAAAADPEHVATITSESSSTYGELLDDARRIATGLELSGITRFAVVEPDAGIVIRLLAGAALAGAEPCQYQPDTDAQEFAQHAASLGHRVVVTRRDDLGQDMTVVRPDALVASSPSPRRGDDATNQPLLIRTTGTTGLPKAARHDWRVVGRTVARTKPAPDQRWLLAYGPQQFAGIQVLLHVSASRGTLVAPFPRQPKDGLRALLDHRVTSVSATPTFWRFLLAEARSRKVAIPPLEQITLGGEASPQSLLDELHVTFPDARVSQVYASTEFGSVTSVTDGKPGIAVEALYGPDTPHANLKVEDGELWVRAAAGMIGYAGEPGHGAAPATASEGVTPAVEGTWRPTGDLVEIIDGRVHFVGRNSEVINVGGVKVHPLPVEERINVLGTVAAARVFGRPNKLTGAIVAVEVVPAAETDVEAIRQQIKDAVSDLPRAAQPRSITFVDALETRGGKTVRGTGA
jgi:acyl-CoA synthetase (AMP-forming)/AMP-acid ligase II